MLNSTIVANRRPLCNRDPPPPRRAKTRAEKTKKKDILSDVLLGALEEIRTPDLLIRSQTLYPTELPAQVQDIYYHRPRGLSTVFAKKFKIFFAKQKGSFAPFGRRPAGLFFGRRQTACSRRPAPGGAPARSAVPPCGLGCPCALCGAPMRSGVPLARSGGVLCALQCSLYALALLCWPPSALRRITPRNTERASPLPRNNSLPRPAAALCPAPPRTAEKKPGRSKRSGRALFISLSGDEAQVSDQALGLPNWQSLLPESEVHISSMFRGSL